MVIWYIKYCGKHLTLSCIGVGSNQQAPHRLQLTPGEGTVGQQFNVSEEFESWQVDLFALHIYCIFSPYIVELESMDKA